MLRVQGRKALGRAHSHDTERFDVTLRTIAYCILFTAALSAVFHLLDRYDSREQTPTNHGYAQ